MNNKPLVSIFCFCKNAEKTIERHIKAVIAALQYYENIEYIVQDGASTDTTLQIYEKYRGGFRGKIRLVSEPDSGASEGFWRALQRCRGEIICASLADEEILPDTIPFIVEQFNWFPDIDIIHGDIYQTDIDGNTQFINKSTEFDLANFLSHQLPLHFAACFFKRSAFKKIYLMPFPGNFQNASDDYFIWAYLGFLCNIKYHNKVFSKYAVHQSAISLNPNGMQSIALSRIKFLETYFEFKIVPESIKHNKSIILKNVFNYWINAFEKAHFLEDANKFREQLANFDKFGEIKHDKENLKYSSMKNKNKQKVLLVSLPGLNTGDEPIFPLGIGYLLAALRQDKRPVQALHYQRSEHVCAQLPEVMQQYAPDIVGLTCTTFNRGLVRKTCAWLRANYPHIRIVLGGVHVSFMYQQVLQDYDVDYVVIGEGEHTLRELCTALDQNLPLHGIKGIAFLQDGQVVTTPPRETVQNLDDLPIPDYSFAGDLMSRSGMGFVISSRGCPVQCNFCSTSSYWGQKVRMNSPRRIVDEMEALIANYGVKKIFFHDDTFNLGIGRVKEICSEITSRGLNVEWGVSCRVSPVSEEMIDTMVAAGCRHICWGIESGSKAMLARIGKRITQEQITKAFECSRKHLGSISVGAFTMVGNPGENAETIAESIKFIGSLQMTDPPSTAVLYILPGTKLYNELLSKQPELARFWSACDEVPYYTVEHTMETLIEWAQRISQSASLVPFDRNRHFWNAVLFGPIPQPQPPALSLIPSELDTVIPPEIKEDEFYFLIQQLVADENINTLLEIGSSAGGGSTEAFVTGLRISKRSPRLFCMEVSKPRFAALKERYADVPFVHCYNVSSVPLTSFPSEKEVSLFYQNIPTNLNNYPCEQVLGWLRQDIDYVRNSGADANGIAHIRRENSIDAFDMVLIDGSEFTGKAEFAEVYGARWILLDDINGYKNYENYQRLKNDPNYEMYKENWELRNGYAVFCRKQDELPIHFFTIVLNGKPFINYHIDVFRHLPFKWRWHIVEGVADLVHDTAWSKASGGHIDDKCHASGLSVDGTSRYIDFLAQMFPENIVVYRKQRGEFWGGKTEMVNAPLVNIHEECLLWQVDVDEFWTVGQIIEARNMFLSNPRKTAAYYWCRFFVGSDLVVSSSNCYSQNPSFEWLRTWKYKPGDFWASHEPPRLCRKAVNEADMVRNLAAVAPFTHAETERAGLVFQHFAYVLPAQLRFKESYYGYQGAAFQWLLLQKQGSYPVLLREYFSWVHDNTTVDKAFNAGVLPIPLPLECRRPIFDPTSFKVILDGVFMQLAESGIARVWLSLLKEWQGTAFAEHLVILDRDNTFPRIDGFRYEVIPRHNYYELSGDRRLLQEVCDRLGADLFISTYYTTPISTPSLMMVHDMIPEIFLAENRMAYPMWIEKQHALEYATEYVAVSHNTAADVCKLTGAAFGKPIHVVPNGVSKEFKRAGQEAVAAFRKKYNIDKQYYLFTGFRENYKNFSGLMEAFSLLPNQDKYVVVTTSATKLETKFEIFREKGWLIQTDWLDADELNAAYTGAVALVYPSLYEGFGLPILEAMSCGCPVVTADSGAMKEVAGDAAALVNTQHPASIAMGMMALQNADLANSYIVKGFRQIEKFRWPRAAADIQRVIVRMLGGIEGEDNLALEEKTELGCL